MRETARMLTHYLREIASRTGQSAVTSELREEIESAVEQDLGDLQKDYRILEHKIAILEANLEALKREVRRAR